MLRANPSRDKALLLKFSVEINEVGEIRQIDTFLDKLTQLKQAYAVFRESVKTTLTDAAVELFSPKPNASASKKSKKKAKKKAPRARAAATKMAARTRAFCHGLGKIAQHYRRSRVSRTPISRQTPALLTSCA